MATEVERPRSWEIMDPFSGSVVNIEDPEIAATLLGRIRVSEDAIRKVKHACEERLVEQMDSEGRWTLRWGALEATAPSPEAAGRIVWMDVGLMVEELRAAGLPDDRIMGMEDSLVTATITYKVSQREAERIAKGKEEWREIIERHRGREEKRRGVNVRLGTGA